MFDKMKKYIIILFLYSSSALTSVQTVVLGSNLKRDAYALANYALCQDLAIQSDDKVMAYYYGEMLKDGLVKSQKYTTSDQNKIQNERVKAALMLNNINSASMSQLCQNRFDPLSRLHYQKKRDK